MTLFPVQISPILGLNQDENPHSLARGELSDADNVVRLGSDVGTRPGTVRPGSTEQYDEKLEAGDVPIQGMFEYRSSFDDNRTLVVIAENSGGTAAVVHFDDRNADIFTTQGGTVLTNDQDHLYVAAEHNDILYLAGGDVWATQTPTCHFLQLDASDVGTPATVTRIESSNLAGGLPVSDGTDDAVPQYVFAWRNYVFANGFRRQGGPSGNNLADCNPTVTRFAKFAEDPTDGDQWLTENTIGFSSSRTGVDSFGSNFATGFGAFQDNEGDWLLLLGNKSLAAVLRSSTLTASGTSGIAADFRVDDHIANGCVGQRAFVSLGLDSGDAIYMSENGFHSIRLSQNFGAREDTFLSWKIRPLFNSLRRSRLKFSVGAYDPVLGIVVFAVTTGSNTAHDTLLVLDVKDQLRLTAKDALWYPWHLSGGIQVNDMRFIRDENENRVLALGTTLGDILHISTDLFSDVDVAASGTAAYTAKFITKHDDHGTTLQNNTLGDVMVTLAPGGTYKPKMRFHFDYGARKSSARDLEMPPEAGAAVFDTAVFDADVFAEEGDERRDSKVYGAGSGRTVAFEVSHSGENEPFRISKIAYQVSRGGEALGDAA